DCPMGRLKALEIAPRGAILQACTFSIGRISDEGVGREPRLAMNTRGAIYSDTDEQSPSIAILINAKAHAVTREHFDALGIHGHLGRVRDTHRRHESRAAEDVGRGGMGE